MRATWLAMVVLAGLVGCETVGEHEDCSGPAACASGLTCKTWFDVAGQERQTCEIGCNSRLCPRDAMCAEEVDDGPEDVCVLDPEG